MSRTRKIGVPSALMLGILAIAGCSRTEPYQKEGIWKPSGVNESNITTMAANPADLSRGRSAGTGTMRTATAAVERLWQGAAGQRSQGPQAAAPAGGAGGRPGGGEAPR